MSDKLPAFQFYPGDWRKDMGIQACSFAARGLWVEMLCLMHESEQRGHLVLAGRPVTPEQLARQTGGSADEVRALLSELEAAGVFSRDGGGVIYSRRMDRDDHIRRVRSEAGKLGAIHGNKGGRPRKDGAEKRQKRQIEGIANGIAEPCGRELSAVAEMPPVSDAQEGDGNGKKRQTEGQTERQTEGQNIPPSSSSSSSSSEYIPAVAGAYPEQVKARKGRGEADPSFDRFWNAYPKKAAKQAALKAWGRISPNEELAAIILAAVERHKLSQDWLKHEGQYIPYPATWLNGGRWEDGLASSNACAEPPRVKRAADIPLLHDDTTYAPAPLGGSTW